MSFTHEIADIYNTDYVKWNILRYFLIHLEYTRAIAYEVENVWKKPRENTLEKYLVERKEKELAILHNLCICIEERKRTRTYL